MNLNSGGRRAVAVAAALGALVTAACGSAKDDGAQSDTSTTTKSGPSTPTEQEPPQPGRMFTANPAITRGGPIPFESWSRVAPDRIAVNFQIGSPECYGVDETTTETGDTVTVELRAGSLPEAAGRMCTMIAVFGTLEVPLKQPLGDRKVLSAR
ncbi:hypothetical protein BJY24_003483 [Nocardia transvalensis]|uniref:Large secreted protein n=1 Tax=Nocardia transvalensis TaxID=37333 RepID=A0A7W9PEN7_9NOCA|nr:hypothetical protein [Nocardia transvalensis]MBB5914616.1 hypothetical protein [Nocardia transvalensis]